MKSLDQLNCSDAARPPKLTMLPRSILSVFLKKTSGETFTKRHTIRKALEYPSISLVSLSITPLPYRKVYTCHKHVTEQKLGGVIGWASQWTGRVAQPVKRRRLVNQNHLHTSMFHLSELGREKTEMSLRKELPDNEKYRDAGRSGFPMYLYRHLNRVRSNQRIMCLDYSSASLNKERMKACHSQHWS